MGGALTWLRRLGSVAIRAGRSACRRPRSAIRTAPRIRSRSTKARGLVVAVEAQISRRSPARTIARGPALSVIRERKGEPLPLATPGTGLSDESGRHPSSGRPTSRATPAGCTRRCWRSRSRRRRRSPRCSWCRTCRTRAPRARRPRPRVRPKHPAGRCAR